MQPLSAGPEVEALVTLARAGDRDAFAALYEQFETAVRGYLRYAAGRDAAEDLAQETFCQAWRYLHTLRETSKFAPWLMQIARNTFRRWVHGRSLDPVPTNDLESLADLMPTGWATALSGFPMVEDRLALTEILRLLPEIYLIPLYLHYVEELSIAKIAILTGYPVSTVKWRLRRGLELCRLLSLKRQTAPCGGKRSENSDDRALAHDPETHPTFG